MTAQVIVTTMHRQTNENLSNFIGLYKSSSWDTFFVWSIQEEGRKIPEGQFNS